MTSTPSPSALPRSLGLFPLPGALLLPRGSLPLNVFEPRYLAMVDDALRTGRMIGMIQPRPGSGKDESRPAPLHDVGCAGRITAFSEIAAGREPERRGRILITLTGLCRFRLTGEEMSPGGYRRGRADYAPFLGDLEEDRNQPAVDRDRLLACLNRYLKRHNLKADWEAIERTPNEMLVTTLSIISPFGPEEKQALLEAADSARRAEILIALTEMALADGADGMKSVQ